MKASSFSLSSTSTSPPEARASLQHVLASRLRLRTHNDHDHDHGQEESNRDDHSQGNHLAHNLQSNALTYHHQVYGVDSWPVLIGQLMSNANSASDGSNAVTMNGLLFQDIVLPSPPPMPHVRLYLSFRNFYTAHIIIKQLIVRRIDRSREAKDDETGQEEEEEEAGHGVDDDGVDQEDKHRDPRSKATTVSKWVTVLPRLQLMEDAHAEGDAEMVHIIADDGFTPDYRPSQLRRLRVYLFQPSPMWRKFELRDIQMHIVVARSPSPDIMSKKIRSGDGSSNGNSNEDANIVSASGTDRVDTLIDSWREVALLNRLVANGAQHRDVLLEPPPTSTSSSAK